jgi:hypothetical protein
MRVKKIEKIIEDYREDKSLKNVRDYLLLKEELGIYDMDFLNALGVASRFKELRGLIDRLIDLSLKDMPSSYNEIMEDL